MKRQFITALCIAVANCLLLALIALVTVMSSCSQSADKKAGADWSGYNVGHIVFEDKAPESEGSRIYASIIKDPDAYIQEQARDVLATLYFSPADSIPPVDNIYYTLEDVEGISAKGGEGKDAYVFYSTRHIEHSYVGENTDKVLFETRGVLLHELTHVYQLSPQGIGDYDTDRVFWCFIEGMADAVRVANGGFTPDDRPRGGNYMDGYRTTGFFLVWLRDNKDPDFLKKFNASTLEVIPWSFDGAIRHCLGENANIDELWHEYQVAVGDIKL